MKILAIIPARGGSKGILRKNIRHFAGRPLIYYSIKSARDSKFVNRIIVSTEDKEIAAVSKKLGAEVPFLRPTELATDKSKVVDAILDLLKKLKASESYIPDYIVLLQPTSPLRTGMEIDEAFKFLRNRNAPAVISVCRTEQLLFTKNNRDELNLVSSKEFLKSSNRQLLPPTYKCDGSMIYIIKTGIFLKEKTFLPKKTVGYEIPRWMGVDLDEPQDFVVGELVFRNRKKIASQIKNFR